MFRPWLNKPQHEVQQSAPLTKAGRQLELLEQMVTELLPGAPPQVKIALSPLLGMVRNSWNDELAAYTSKLVRTIAARFEAIEDESEVAL